MKIKFDSDDNLPLNKIQSLAYSKYYRQIFLDDCLYEKDEA